MKKRIFIAIGLSEGLQKKILNWEKALKPLSVRRIAGKNLHITLIPPWYAEEKEIKKVKKILQAAAKKNKPFNINFEKVAFGPLPRSPRLIWAEGKSPDGLLELKNNLEKALRKKPEKRSFLLHLTLARFNPKDFKKFKIKILDKKISWKEKIKNFVLMESHLSRSGADYEILTKFNLYDKQK